MKSNWFENHCRVSDFVLPDGTYLPECQGSLAGGCDCCGFAMAGEMYSMMHLKPDTVMAGMKITYMNLYRSPRVFIILTE